MCPVTNDFISGIAAIGVYTVCFVWAMEVVSGKWKTVTGIIMAFAWPISRLGENKTIFLTNKRASKL